MVMRDPTARGWPHQGKRTDSRELAEEWAFSYLHWIRGELRRDYLKVSAGPALKKAADLFLEHRAETVEKATWSADRTAVNHLLDAFPPDRSLTSIETKDVQKLVDRMLRQGYRATTLGTYLKSWSVFFRYAGDWVPTQDVTVGSKTSKPKNETDTLSTLEIRALLAAAEKVDAQRIGEFPSGVLACGLGLYMGLRQGEIFALQWADIHPESRTVRIRYQVPKDSTKLKPTKGKMSRTALVLPDWWPMHRTHAVGFVCGRKGRPVGTRTQRNLITRILDTAQLNELGRGWHVLRHTYAQQFMESGGTLEELSKSLGHSSIATTQRVYEHMRPDVAARRAASRIYGTD